MVWTECSGQDQKLNAHTNKNCNLPHGFLSTLSLSSSPSQSSSFFHFCVVFFFFFRWLVIHSNAYCVVQFCFSFFFLCSVCIVCDLFGVFADYKHNHKHLRYLFVHLLFRCCFSLRATSIVFIRWINVFILVTYLSIRFVVHLCFVFRPAPAVCVCMPQSMSLSLSLARCVCVCWFVRWPITFKHHLKKM